MHIEAAHGGLFPLEEPCAGAGEWCEEPSHLGLKRQTHHVMNGLQPPFSFSLCFWEERDKENEEGRLTLQGGRGGGKGL